MRQEGVFFVFFFFFLAFCSAVPEETSPDQ